MAKLWVEREQLPYDPPKIPKPPLCNNFSQFSLGISLFFIYLIIKRLNIYFYFKFHLEKGKEMKVFPILLIFQNYKSYKRGKEVKKNSNARDTNFFTKKFTNC